MVTHGCLQLSLGYAHVPGLRNITKKHLLRKTETDGKEKLIRKSIAGVIAYMPWEGDNMFQSAWELEDILTMVFFSSVIDRIIDYVKNYILCPAANLYWFL